MDKDFQMIEGALEEFEKVLKRLPDWQYDSDRIVEQLHEDFPKLKKMIEQFIHKTKE